MRVASTMDTTSTKRRWLPAALTLTAALAVLPGCGAGAGEGSRAHADAATPAQGAAPATQRPAATAPADAADDGRFADYTKPSEAELKKELTPLQYRVTQEEGTEPPFRNEYWDNHRDGIYVDVVSGEPLFSSREKYESGTGWPSFWKPLVPDNVVTRVDRSLFVARTEVRSKHADSHLGHVFDDGPAPTGLRYCMNSAALRFIPVDRLEAEGYGRFLDHFEEPAAEPK